MNSNSDHRCARAACAPAFLFLLTIIGMSMATARTSHAQVFSGHVPNAMTFQEYTRYAQAQQWTDAQHDAIAERHSAYRKAYAAFREASVDPFKASLRDVPRGSALDLEREAFAVPYKRYRELCDEAAAIDNAFISGCDAVLADAQRAHTASIQRRRAIRRLQTGMADTARRMNPGATISLIDLLDRQKLSPEARAALRPTLDAYELALLKRTNRAHTQIVRAMLEVKDRLNEQGITASMLEDREGQRAANEALQSAMEAVQRNLQRACADIIDLHRRTLGQIDTVASDRHASVLYNAFVKFAYPGVFSEDRTAQVALIEAEFGDVSSDTRRAVVALRDAYDTRRRWLEEQTMDLVDGIRADRTPFRMRSGIEEVDDDQAALDAMLGRRKALEAEVLQALDVMAMDTQRSASDRAAIAVAIVRDSRGGPLDDAATAIEDERRRARLVRELPSPMTVADVYRLINALDIDDRTVDSIMASFDAYRDQYAQADRDDGPIGRYRVLANAAWFGRTNGGEFGWPTGSAVRSTFESLIQAHQSVQMIDDGLVRSIRKHLPSEDHDKLDRWRAERRRAIARLRLNLHRPDEQPRFGTTHEGRLDLYTVFDRVDLGESGRRRFDAAMPTYAFDITMELASLADIEGTLDMATRTLVAFQRAGELDESSLDVRTLRKLRTSMVHRKSITHSRIIGMNADALSTIDDILPSEIATTIRATAMQMAFPTDYASGERLVDDIAQLMRIARMTTEQQTRLEDLRAAYSRKHEVLQAELAATYRAAAAWQPEPDDSTDWGEIEVLRADADRQIEAIRDYEETTRRQMRAILGVE